MMDQRDKAIEWAKWLLDPKSSSVFEGIPLRSELAQLFLTEIRKVSYLYDRIRNLERALVVTSDQLEGIALAAKIHGENINPHFLIDYGTEAAEKARKVLADSGNNENT